MHIIKDKNVPLIIKMTAVNEWDHQIIVPLEDYVIDGFSDDTGELITKFNISHKQAEHIVRKLLEEVNFHSWDDLFKKYGVHIIQMRQALINVNDKCITDGWESELKFNYVVEGEEDDIIEGRLQLIIVKDHHWFA